MDENIITGIYCDVDDFCKALSNSKFAPILMPLIFTPDIL
jgi:hypothetical protein